MKSLGFAGSNLSAYSHIREWVGVNFDVSELIDTYERLLKSSLWGDVSNLKEQKRLPL